MEAFKFALGEIVRIAPTDRKNAYTGLVVGHLLYLDGSLHYVVSMEDYATHGVVRHTFAEYELQPLEG